MKKALMVVESPTKARTIGKYLKDSFEVVATVGHFRDLPKSKMGVDPKNGFAIDYVIDSKKRDVVKQLELLASRADKIYLASDPDREGEAIAWHTQWLLSNKQVPKNNFQTSSKKQIPKVIKRISFHEITKEAIEEAIKNAGEIDMNMVNAQQGRRVLDRLVGYSLSPILWRKVRRGLSAGRVQSVAVRLIVEREAEIEAFKKETYYKVGADFGFMADLFKIDGKQFITLQKIKLFDGEYSFSKSLFITQEQADKFVGKLSKDFVVAQVGARETIKTPLPAFTTSKLQQMAARRFGWSGKQTMSLAQRLYEQGHITYHRTDSVNLSPKAIEGFRKFIGEKYGEKYVAEKVRVFKNNSKNAQEAHEAIRPTKVNVLTIDTADAKENKLYELIWRRAVATQASVARLSNTTVILKNNNGEFKSIGVKVNFDGFLRISGDKHEDQLLPELVVGQALKSKSLKVEEVTTNPPPRYTDASLVASLEKQGIGRPSTYAPIISTIILRQYVNREEGKIVPTALGKATNEFLAKNFSDILSLPFTAGMEENLDLVALGKLDWKKMMKDFWGKFEKEIKVVEKTAERVKVATESIGEKCPDCHDGDLVIREGKFGKFISCDQFPECKYTRAFRELAGFNCPLCGKEGVVKKTSKGKKFFGCSDYPKCTWAAWKKP
ncbi:type I DNA topoisomerase [Candidatus Shapirobacteria bacterium CG_4_10_14_3_um_filter_35_13]|uniref:DNA topoisomerase 1 n=1 Tax=Candidatus Shapirobacteria bacterium CG_4_10_14_3_um_filter_35_13 TaxID=1974873 RepID=A0A2M7LIN0_9BACT|nr:MAG: type I DNA topoisomerase [Candidatus Shapirobacteria bacterium CG_4_10_14_3_um_filter_35_13]